MSYSVQGVYAVGDDAEEGASCSAQGMLYDEAHDSCYTVDNTPSSGGGGATRPPPPTGPPPSAALAGMAPYAMGAAAIGLVAYWILK